MTPRTSFFRKHSRAASTMLFQSQTFVLAFLPVAVLLWYFMPGFRLREWTLIALSLFFFGWWDVRFVPLLLAQSLVSWLIAELYLRTGSRHRAILVAGIVANLAVLGFFKYWTFLAESVLTATGLKLPAPTIILPIGISFFTFEIVSYLVDLGWRGAPRYPLRRFLLFVALFPRLIAGPIVRHNEILPQFDLDPWRAGVAERIAKGATLFVIGLAKKVFLADRLAPYADEAFASAAKQVPDIATAWTGALAFTFQLLLDFSAYSEMAIGVAMMLGLMLPQNFNAPYHATSLSDFWRRWHMSLSRYLRDYVYIPLGGSREGPFRFAAATLFTMGLCGLWHGAGWTFVAWGLLHGAGLVVTRAWRETQIPVPAAAAWLLTFAFVVAGWVLFRAPDFATALNMYAGMAGTSGTFVKPAGQALMLIGVAAALSFVGPTSYQIVTERLRPDPRIAVAIGLAAVIAVLEVGRGQPQSFIYFQF